MPVSAGALEGLTHLLSLLRILGLSEGSPPATLEALVAAGVVPPLVALLGRWKGFKAAGVPADSPDPRNHHWSLKVAEIAAVVAALAARSPAARRQLRDGGAAPLLRALVLEREARQTELLRYACDALRCLAPRS